MTIKRIKNVIYLSTNNGIDTKIIDLSDINNTYDYPITIGASLDADKNPQRYFKETLSNIKIKVYGV